jgi:hypothetical protein
MHLLRLCRQHCFYLSHAALRANASIATDTIADALFLLLCHWKYGLIFELFYYMISSTIGPRMAYPFLKIKQKITNKTKPPKVGFATHYSTNKTSTRIKLHLNWQHVKTKLSATVVAVVLPIAPWAV